jgi:hypothetical protein
MAARANLLQQVPAMRTANEDTFAALRAQGIGQRQASHDVPGADLKRRIGAENDLHSA